MHKIILLPFLFLFIFSCSEEVKEEEEKKSNFNVPTDLSFQNKAISLISSDPNIVSYGSIKMNQLLTKGIINSEMGKSSVMKITLKDLEKMGDYINMGVPLYYAISFEDVESSPMGMMPTILLFGKVKDSKNLISMLKDKNSNAVVSKSKTYTLIEEGPMAMAVSDDDFIARIATGEDSQRSSQAEMDGLMSYLHANKINSDVQANLDQSKDITIAYNQEGLMKMVKNMPMYENNPFMKNDLMDLNMIQSASMNLAFEKGEIKLIMNSLYTDKMKEFSFFNENSKAVIEKLGQGNPAAALAVNINVEEIERFRKKYYPQSITNQLNSINNPLITEMIPEELAVIEALIMKDGIKSFIDGQMGAVFFIDNEVPEGNFYMGIGENLKKLFEKSDMNSIFGLLHSLNLNNTEFSGYSSKKHARIQGEGINAEKFKNFGEKPFSMYIDFTKIPTEGLLSGIDRSLKDYEVLLEMIDLVTLEFDMNGADFTIQLKDKSKNALSQLADQFYKFLSIDQILKMI